MEEQNESNQETASTGVTIKRLVIWLLGNIIIWAPGLFWLFTGNEYAGNYSVFIVCIHFGASLAVFSDETIKKVQKKGPSVHPDFNFAVDAIWAVVLATFGHYWLAGMYIVGGKFMQEVYKKPV